jgi:hypothetical protein
MMIQIDEIATALWPATGTPESFGIWIATSERCNGACIALLRMDELADRFDAVRDLTTLALVATERAMMALGA